ncbi:hypothetical protein FACS1894105_13890 [Clostridia bacterium]|nr:hypothetical protein FACS1894105_13890 [Clostridia bacterium]
MDSQCDESVNLFGGAEYVCRTLAELGYCAYIVGGAVRDTLMGKAPKDYDIATSARPDKVTEIFESRGISVIPTGIKYGTVTVRLHDKTMYEVTTFRTDGIYSDGRRPEAVTFSDSIEDDLARRDFTMNAIAMSVTDGREFIDPFGGRYDIERGIIRCVGDARTRFCEDALRIIRAVRFRAVTGFSIAPDTAHAIVECVPMLKNIAKERITSEWIKILESERPETLAGLRGLKRLTPDFRVRLAAAYLCGKGCGKPDEVRDDLRELKLSSDDYHAVLRIYCACGSLMQCDSGDIAAMKRILAEFGVEATQRSAEIIRVCFASAHDCEIDRIIASGEPYLLKHLAIDGGDLLYKFPGISGKLTGKLLDMCLSRVKSHLVAI